MDHKIIEDTLSQIVEIDVEAIEIEEKEKRLDSEKEKELKKTLRSIEFEHMKKARKEGSERYKAILESAAAEEERILSDGEAKAKRYDAYMESRREEIAGKIFVKLLESKYK